MAVESKTTETKVFRYSWAPGLTILGLTLALLAVLAVVQGFSAVGVAVIGGMGALFASYFLYLAMRVRLVINADGVEFVERGKRTFVDWANIDAVSSASVPGRSNLRRYQLFSKGNVVLSFENEIADNERAYRIIERRIAVSLYPNYRAALDRGESVMFGAVRLSKLQLNVHFVSLALADARLMREGNSLKVMNRNTGETAIAVDEGDVPNINILIRACSEMSPHLVASGST
jgi:hypothetical protein